MVIEPNKPTTGLRLIATLEAAKGIIAVGLAIILFVVGIHHSHPFIQRIVHHFHLTDSRHAPHFVIEMLTHPERFQFGVWILLACAYAMLRFVEAYGLWLARRWGEWIAILSAGVYIPFEIYAIIHHATPLKLGLLAMNLAFVIYLGIVLVSTRRKRALAEQALAAREAENASATD